jgi:tetratricopeptide (TPR) repeat protein
LASIGGERYSKEVLVRVADAYYNQSEYQRAVNTYRFLIEQKPTSVDAAGYQRRIVEAHSDALERDEALAAMKELVERYGPGTEWAVANQKYPNRLKRALAASEALVFQRSRELHAEAQRLEKGSKRPNLDLYRQAAAMYEVYLSRFGDHEHGPEVRFLRAEILYFKLGQYEDAGDAYVAVARATSRPPPTQWPPMAAITSWGVFSRRSKVSFACRQK